MRLIDANRFRRFAHEQLDEFNVYSVDEIFEMIDEQPTVEAKPVVHCKDCKHWKSEKGEFGRCKDNKHLTHGYEHGCNDWKKVG